MSTITFEPTIWKPKNALENKYIEDYLQMHGASWDCLDTLDKADARQLVAEAYRYAALKLAEVEARAKFVQKIEMS